MTAEATFKAAPVPAASNPALLAASAVGLVAAATLAGAWFFQLVLDVQPCPLCLEQRYAYYLAIPLQKGQISCRELMSGEVFVPSEIFAD